MRFTECSRDHFVWKLFGTRRTKWQCLRQGFESVVPWKPASKPFFLAMRFDHSEKMMKIIRILCSCSSPPKHASQFADASLKTFLWWERCSKPLA